MPAPLPQLVFSTRGAEPDSSQLSREIIAETPGIPQATRRRFAELADMAGSVLGEPELPQIWIFCPLGDSRGWLLCHGVSLGLYRKGIHRLLFHGLVLGEEHLKRCQANPFLLPEVAGLELLTEHPGQTKILEPVELPAERARSAGQANAARMASLTAKLEEWHDALPALVDALLMPGSPTVCLFEGAPNPELIELALLHLHPDDRAELSWHTWSSYQEPLLLDLQLGRQRDENDLRRRSPELRLLTRESRAEPGSLGELATRLYRERPEPYPKAIDDYRITRRAEGHARTLGVREAALCLRHELNEELRPEERKIVEKLRLRGRSETRALAQELSGLWAKPDELSRRLAALRDRPLEVSAEQLLGDVEAAHAESPLEKWGLAMVAHFAGSAGLAAEKVAELFALLFPHDEIEGLLAQFETSQHLDLVDELLEPHLLGAAELSLSSPAGPTATGARYWPAYLGWRLANKLPVHRQAAAIETMARSAPPQTALAVLRELQQLLLEAGMDAFAYRLRLQAELPLLTEDQTIARTRHTVFELLASEGRSDKVLRSFLGSEPTASAVIVAFRDWLVSSRAPETWERWQRLMQQQGKALGPSARGAAAELAATVASSHHAGHFRQTLDLLDAALRGSPGTSSDLLQATAEMLVKPLEVEPRPPRSTLTGVGQWLDAYLARPANLATDRLAARLLAAVLPLLDDLVGTSNRQERRSAATFREALRGFLKRLLERKRTEEVLRPADDWAHRLRDDLLREPARRGRPDARVYACRALYWSLWAEAPGNPHRWPPDLEIRRRNPADSGATDLHEQEEILQAVVPAEVRQRAKRILAWT